MAYLSIKTVNKVRYFYIKKSIRRGRRVHGKILEYLGREDRIDPKRLKRAMEYWGVKRKKKGGK